MSTEAETQLSRLLDIMAKLRAENGCPWDREQDIRTLRPYLIEEAFEVLDEMDRVGAGGPWRPLCEELGDLLFQIVFHAQLARERGEFTFADVCHAISDKIVSRHPHVFGEGRVDGAEQVLENWAKLKAAEKKRKTGSEGSVLDGVPFAAPALVRAERLTEKASRIGFDWPDLAGVRGKLEEELGELDEAISQADPHAIEHELGDVLFSLANLARFVKTPAEDALREANRRFTERFHGVEAGLRQDGVPFGKATLPQMEAHWQRAKQAEAALPPPTRTAPSAVARLTLPCTRWEQTRQTYDALAPVLGWELRRAGDGERIYDLGGLELLLERGQEAAPPSRGVVELAAPSPEAVDVLSARLREVPGVRVEPPTRSAARVFLEFSDPEGQRWRYGCVTAR